MANAISKELEPRLRDRSTRFVFPSEICAEAWLAESLRSSDGSRPAALESDRFLGWDRLKERAQRADGRKSSDAFVRSIFAAHLLAKNAERPFLLSILPPEHAGLWQPFAGYVASRLAALGSLPAALGSLPAAMDATGGRKEPGAKDWLEVRKQYSDFLDGIGRFEPAYEPRSLRELEGQTLIFFPELIEDFAEYAPVLESMPSVRLVRLPPPPGRVELLSPATALAELRDSLSEAGGLLDRGVAAERMAFTIASLDRYRPYLEREAALLSVPVAVRSGSSLAATAGGRLFAALRDAEASGSSFDSLRDLLASKAWPWKDRELWRSLIATGKRFHAVAPWPEKGRMADPWELILGGTSLTSYRRLRSRISAVVGASDFRSLLKAYNAFRSEFLSQDRGEWDSAADLTLASCVEVLEGLAAAQRETGLDVGKAAFGLFMHELESRRYVDRDKDEGIPVYEWRVAAGIPCERHFVLGTSQEAITLPSRGFDFLDATLRRRLSRALYGDPLAAERDAAPRFVDAYAISGSSVSFSCPQSGFEGDAAAHGYLVSLALARGSPEAPEAARHTARDESYRREAAWISGRGPAPARLHAIQALGLAKAARAPASRLSEGAALEASTAALASARSRREGDGFLRLDATAIDYYLSCPYSYLYLRLLGAGPEPSGIAFVDALFLGEVYHAALARLFTRIREADGRFRPELASEYADLVPACLDEAFADLSRERGAFVRVVLEAYEGRLELYLRNLVAAEAERFPGLEIGPLEGELVLEYPELRILLRGRIDRISRSEAGEIVIDYKKGALPSKSSVEPRAGGAAASDADASIAEAQIPCYLRLVSGRQDAFAARQGARSDGAAAGARIDSAWYVSIEGDGSRRPGSGACAFGAAKGAYVPVEGLEDFLAAFDRALRLVADGIGSGAYPFAPKDTQREACENCGARGICRERYALRFSGGAGS
jgi:hypothetical protein